MKYFLNKDVKYSVYKRKKEIKLLRCVNKIDYLDVVRKLIIPRISSIGLSRGVELSNEYSEYKYAGIEI